jgi:hypothetical protein
MLSRCHIQRSSGSTIVGLGEMSRNLVHNDKMDISNTLNHKGTSSSILLTHTSILSTQFFTHFPKYPIPIFKAIILAKQGSIIAIKGGYPTKFLQ